MIEINSSSPHPPETTEVLYGNNNVQRRTLEVFLRVKETLDGCNESTEVAMNVKYEAIWNGFAQLKRKGVRLRAITEVTPDNITYVKKNNGTFRDETLKRSEK